MTSTLPLAAVLLMYATAAYGGIMSAGMPVDPSTAHPSRVIVRYATGALEARSAAHASTDSIAKLERRFRVQRARPLFARAGALDTVRLRFTARAARAPRNARMPALESVFVLDLASGVDPQQAAAEFARDPGVVWAEPDYVARAAFTPNDPFFSTTGSIGPFPDLWGLHAANAAAAWDVARGDGIVVAVIDTGVKYTHPDLRDRMWVNPGEARNRVDDDGNGYVDDILGWDFVDGKSTPKDRHGHGTHVAGTIAATGNNGIGVVGVAFGARIMPLRGLNSRGSGFSSQLAEAIVYAAEHGADVLNNSWQGPASSAVSEAVSAATALGAVVVFAAGNSSSTFLGTAGDRNSIAVSAAAPDGSLASFSNRGSNISVAAPGVSVLSLRGPRRVGGTTVGGKYKVLSGTSMAAPHVAGVAALLLSDQPELTVDQVRWHLELNADQPGAPGYAGQRWNPFFGFGHVDAERVFLPPPVTTRLTTPTLVLHGLAGSLIEGVATAEFSFTTSDPVSWTLSTPAWLAPDVVAGMGAATVTLDLDGTSSTPATYVGDLAIDAPASSEGGASLAVTAHLHGDVRVGGAIELTDQMFQWGEGGVFVAGNGQGVLAAWVELPGTGGVFLRGAFVADDGTVTGPFLIDASCIVPNPCFIKNSSEIAIASNGSEFLVTWLEYWDEPFFDPLRYTRHEVVRAVRVAPSGTVLGSPLTLAENVEKKRPDGSFDQFLYNLSTAWDGDAYTTLWGRLDFGTTYADGTHYWIRRVDSSGAFTGALTHVYPAADTTFAQPIRPKIACATGSCLVAWKQFDGEVGADGGYVDKLVGRRFAGTTPLDSPPLRIMVEGDSLDAIASNGADYLVAGTRMKLCAGLICGFDMVGARVTGAGVALDPDGIRLNQTPGNGYAQSLSPRAAMWNGTHWIVTWPAFAREAGVAVYICHPFAARVATDGTLVDAEAEGLLLAPGSTLDCFNDPVIAPAATRSFIAWAEPGNHSPKRIFAQAVLPH